MDTTTKGILIGGIIAALNLKVMEENKKLVEAKRYSEQKPLHGGDMFLQLAFLSDSEIDKIARACGI